MVKMLFRAIRSMEGSGATGKPLIVKAKPHMAYELKNVASNVAPDQIHATREGNNLKIKLGKKASKDDDSADIIIEGYFDNDASLVGAAENGQYYNFVAQGADPADSYYSLGGPVIGTETETDWTTAALGALALGALAAAAGGGGGSHPDATPPGSLTISLVDDAGPVKGEMPSKGTVGGNNASNFVTDDNTPTIIGTTEAGATVTLKDEAGNTLGTTTADSNGNYTFTPTAPLSDGQHYIAAIAADAAGNSITNTSIIFTVDTIAPNAPIVNPTDGSPITGTAEAGSIVAIKDGNGNTIGTTTADGNGSYTFAPAPDQIPVDGTQLIVTATDAAGNTSLPGTGIVNSDVPDAPIVMDDVGSIQGVVANNSTTDDTKPTFSSDKTDIEAGSTIRVYDNGILLGTTTAAADGSWSFTPSTAFADGSQHSVSYTKNGGPSSPAVNFTVDTSSPSSVSMTLTDDVAPIIGTIANGSTTNDTKPTISGATEAGATITIKDGATVLGTVIADDNGNYTFTPAASLGEGSHSVTATAADAAGNSKDSATINFTVDTTAPTTSTNITTITTDTGTVGDFITSDNTLVIGGTNTALANGEKVQLSLDGGATWADATQNTSTTWSYDNTSHVMPIGSYTLESRVVDAAGNIGAADTQSLTIVVPAVIDLGSGNGQLMILFT